MSKLFNSRQQPLLGGELGCGAATSVIGSGLARGGGELDREGGGAGRGACPNFQPICILVSAETLETWRAESWRLDQDIAGILGPTTASLCRSLDLILIISMILYHTDYGRYRSLVSVAV